jgi:excisionase family DNA binding protein
MTRHLRPLQQVEPDDLAIAYTVDDVARRLRCSERHIQRLVAAGTLQSLKAGRRRLIPRSALLQWLSGRA